MSFWNRRIAKPSAGAPDAKGGSNAMPRQTNMQWRLGKDGEFGNLKDESGVVRGVWFRDKRMASAPLVVGKLVATYIEKGVKIDQDDLATFLAVGFGGMTVEPAEGGYCVWFPSAARLESKGDTVPSAGCSGAGVEPAAVSVRFNPKDGAEMVYVSSGPFLMGDVGRDNNPRRTVTLDAFWIYKNDVTVAQYRKFCQATQGKMPDAPRWGWQDDHPMVNVTWDDAKAYCDWAGAVLPTEAQWEKAARGTDGRKNPWGNRWDSGKLCCCSAGKMRTNPTPVGSFGAGASPYGCLDMAGNVWQWCADRYDANYAQNAPSDASRVLRGGAWKSGEDSDFFRCAKRMSSLEDARDEDVGFRAAMPV